MNEPEDKTLQEIADEMNAGIGEIPLAISVQYREAHVMEDPEDFTEFVVPPRFLASVVWGENTPGVIGKTTKQFNSPLIDGERTAESAFFALLNSISADLASKFRGNRKKNVIVTASPADVVKFA